MDYILFIHGVLLLAVRVQRCRANSRLTQIILKGKNAEIQPQAVPLFEERGTVRQVERWRVLERRRRSRTNGATVCNEAKINGKPFEIRVPLARIINRLRDKRILHHRFADGSPPYDRRRARRCRDYIPRKRGNAKENAAHFGGRQQPPLRE